MIEPDFNKSDGLVPAIVQDAETKEVLMMAYMNQESWQATLKTGKATYWSRFRGMYFAGDGAKRDAEGYFWFCGRDDDVINTAGHLVGPFEIESALLEHPAVAESAAIGKPDPVNMEVVKAFVVLKPGLAESDRPTEADLIAWARENMAVYKAPRQVAFRDSLPATGAACDSTRTARPAASVSIWSKPVFSSKLEGYITNTKIN